jgi:hypothetical protein
LSVISVISAENGEDAGDLADDAGFVDGRLPGNDAGLLALVDDDLAREGVAGRVENLGDLPIGFLALLDRQQLA